MTWHIVTMQKQIANLNYGHNYVALVNDQGKIIEEYHGFHGVPGREGFTINDPVAGNFLVPIRGAPGVVMGDERNVPLRTAHTIPILRDDGTYANGIAQDLVSGNEASVRSVWNAGVNATDAALAGGKFLYVATDVRPFFGKDGINSNSVWGTFLRSIGIADPGSHNGPLIIPGVDVDLRTAPSNNPLFGQPGQDQLYNRQQHGALDPSDGKGTRFGAISGAPAAAADLAEGDPDGNGDLAALLKPAGSAGGGALTMQGVQQLQRFLDADKTVEGRAQSAMEQNLLRAARGEIAAPDGPDGTASPEGETRFQNFLGAYFPALDQGLNSGKTAAELLTPGSPDYLGKLIPAFTPPPAQKSNLVLAAANDGIEVAPLPPLPPSPRNNIPGTNIPDRGISEGGASFNPRVLLDKGYDDPSDLTRDPMNTKPGVPDPNIDLPEMNDIPQDPTRLRPPPPPLPINAPGSG